MGQEILRSKGETSWTRVNNSASGFVPGDASRTVFQLPEGNFLRKTFFLVLSYTERANSQHGMYRWSLDVFTEVSYFRI